MFSFRKMLALYVCAGLILSTASCGKKNDAPEKVTTAETTMTIVTTVTEAPQTTTTVKTTEKETTKKTEKKYFNILTGKNDVSKGAKGKRPVAIMINNIEAALPQYGIYNADVMFECPVEGGITRMMALYADYTKVPDVCSVRSCRYYFAYFAASFDAVYLHWGIDKKVAASKLSEFNIDHIDGEYNGVLFLRDPDRMSKYSTEHTGYCDGSAIPEQIESAGIRSDLETDEDEGCFAFNSKFKKLSDVSAEKATVSFSNQYYSTFTYDEKSKTYKKQHNGSKHMDSAADKQLEYTNVLALESKDIHIINENNGLLSLDWTGGSGYCFSAGTVKKIYWTKDSETGRLSFTTSEGKELKINPGKTYIGVTKSGMISYS